MPLDKNQIKTLAIIGPRADEVLLDWYSGTPPYRVTPLEGIRNKVGENVQILTAENNADGKAAEIAAKADVAIVLVGNHPSCDAGWADCPVPSEGKESVDRQSLSLEYEDLIKVVHQANENTVVVLISSFPYAINWTEENVPAIVHLTQNSQELGNGLADVLFGDYNPAGRLTQTWVESITDLPPLMDYNIRNGRTYMYFEGDPLYAFGHGLSYTDFRYEGIQVDKNILMDGETATVKVDIRNTGKMDGEEVIQLYVKHLDSSVERPIKELNGFRRVKVPAGKTVTVDLPLNAEDLKYWNVNTQQFELENGKIEIQVGGASDKISQTKTINIQK